MRYFSYIISFFTHPIWLPIYAAMLVLFYIPISLPLEEVRFTWLLLLLITVALPILVYLLLLVLRKIEQPFSAPPTIQKWLLYGYILMLLGVAFGVTPIDKYPILYFYLMNLLISCFIIVFMQFFRIQGNVFVMGMAGLTTFTLLLSIWYEKEMTCPVALFIFLSGAIITAQSYLTQQTMRWLLLSYLAGVLPQLSLLIVFKNLLFGMAA